MVLQLFKFDTIWRRNVSYIGETFNKNISRNKILTEGIQNINLVDILHAKSFKETIKALLVGVNLQLIMYKLLCTLQIFFLCIAEQKLYLVELFSNFIKEQ